MRFLSVCSGIEAASVAWEPMGWRAAAFSEIAPFPSAVLAHRFGSNLPGEALSANGVPAGDEAYNLVAHALRGEGFDASEDGTGRRTPLVPVAFDLRGRDGGATFEGPHDTANIRAASGGSSRSYVATDWAVRRLTPTECERLQAFPDGRTAVPYRGKQAADGPRYQALGNSMAVNVMRWIGRRVEMAEAVRARLTR